MVWWVCPKGPDHVWRARVDSRRKHGCAVCANFHVVKSNSLATLNRKLARQWDKNKNGKLTPWQVTPFSAAYAWWKCPKGPDHEWRAQITERHDGSGCPICTNQKIVRSNSLRTLRPDLSKEWHPTKNKVTPDSVGVNYTGAIWWLCRKFDDHVWRSQPIDRKPGSKCPYCLNRKLAPSNSLSAVLPTLAAQWHPTLNGKIKPNQVMPGSAVSWWWKCEKGRDHAWRSDVRTRLKSKLKCPVCTGRKIVPSNSLAALRPDVSAEWHPTKNGQLKATEIGPGSGLYIWWQCARDTTHVWRAQVHYRTAEGTCKKCRRSPTGLELTGWDALQALGINFTPEQSVGNYRIDAMVKLRGGQLLAIEFDGCVWHACWPKGTMLNAAQLHRLALDARRDRQLAKQNIRTLRICERELMLASREYRASQFLWKRLLRFTKPLKDWRDPGVYEVVASTPAALRRKYQHIQTIVPRRRISSATVRKLINTRVPPVRPLTTSR